MILCSSFLRLLSTSFWTSFSWNWALILLLISLERTGAFGTTDDWDRFTGVSTFFLKSGIFRAFIRGADSWVNVSRIFCSFWIPLTSVLRLKGYWRVSSLAGARLKDCIDYFWKSGIALALNFTYEISVCLSFFSTDAKLNSLILVTDFSSILGSKNL